MALIYKPNVLYMTPRNESVDVTNEITLSFVFKGYKMQKAVGQLYQNSNIGEWTKLGNSFAFKTYNVNYPAYNNQTITWTSSSSTQYNNIKNNKDSLIGWQVDVYGLPSTQVAAANNRMTPVILGFETGDQVATYSGSGTTTVYNQTYINNYDSKLTLGSVNTGTDAEGTDLTNTFTVTEATYINLTTGDSVQLTATGTKYYVNKVNEGASSPLAYYIKFYNTQANAVAGGTTGVITGTSVQNNTYYVNATTVTSNIFYVGVIGGNVIQLYTSKEAALQGVSEAVVPLTSGSTYTIQPFESSQIVPFTPIVANYVVFNLADVYDGQTVSLEEDPINENVYHYVYDGEGELHTGQRLGYIVSGNKQYSYIRVWDSETLSLFSNRQAAFNNNTTYLTKLPETISGDIYLAEILSGNYMFALTSAQWASSNIPMIYSWTASLYTVELDNNGDVISRTLIEKSDVQYTAQVQYEFNHLLLSCLSDLSGVYNDSLGRYEIVFDMIDNTGYTYTGSSVIDVGYYVVATDYSPVITANNCDSSITVDWNNAVSITGVKSGSGSLSYIQNYMTNGNYGLQIPANGRVTFNVDIPEGSVPLFLFRFTNDGSGGSGVIMTLDGDSQTAVLSYEYINSTSGRFLLSVTNKALGSTIQTVVSTDIQYLVSNKVYLIGYAQGSFYIKEYADYIQ